MLFSAFISLFVATAFAQAPTPQEYLHLYAAPAIMVEVARCESGFQQFKNGKVVRDYDTGTHVGIYQISEDWIPTAKKQGYNIYTAQGNVAFALYLYRQKGLQPWEASRATCWGKTHNKAVIDT